jgi:hypothetical protein
VWLCTELCEAEDSGLLCCYTCDGVNSSFVRVSLSVECSKNVSFCRTADRSVGDVWVQILPEDVVPDHTGGTSDAVLVEEPFCRRAGSACCKKLAETSRQDVRSSELVTSDTAMVTYGKRCS